MIKSIKRRFKKYESELIDKIAFRTEYLIEREVYGKFFADIGIETLEEVCRESRILREKQGYIDGENMGNIYNRIKNDRSSN